MTKRKRETFVETCEQCKQELTALHVVSNDWRFCQRCLATNISSKKYRGPYSLTEYRTAITEAYHHVSRQLLHGIHAQDKQDAADWLEKHGPLARALQIAANHGIK